jgi:pentapeptide repeat protein
MSESMLNNETDPALFVCSCDESFRSSCAGLAAFRGINDRTYCILHFPEAKGEEFASAVKAKLDANNFDFSGVYFPESFSFFGRHFPSEPKFEGAVFASDVNFGEAIFDQGVNFSRALFKGDATFLKAELKGPANFGSVEFHKRAVFNATQFFEDALFTFAVFNGETDFQRASFGGLLTLDFVAVKDTLTFALIQDYKKVQGFAADGALWMSGARIDRPENVSFQSLSLRPGWFVNVDVRKFNFIEVDWKELSQAGFRYDIREDIAYLEKSSVEIPYRLLSITYRQLANNAEESHRYRQGSEFRYLSMDVLRREHPSFSAMLTLDWWYWLASGYGELAGRAFLILLLLIFVFGCAYLVVGFSRSTDKRVDTTRSTSVADPTGAPIRPVSAAFLYSSEVLTLQKPEPKPSTACARILVTLETILGPTQLALLALAIRRKFMR